MASTAATWLVLWVALVAANLPFVNQRLFAVGPPRADKPLGWRAVELLVFWAITLAIGFALEARQGQARPQHWEFFAAFGFLFVTFAFPGFVWRYLRRGR